MSFRFMAKLTLKQFASNFKSYIVIAFSLVVCIVSLFMITEAIFYSSTFLENINTYKRTYDLDMPVHNDNYLESYDFYMNLINESKYPKIEKINSVYAAPLTKVNVDEYYLLQIYSEKIFYAPTIEIVKGNMFSENEINNGTNVIILDTNYNKEVGETIKINNTEYNIIGLSNNGNFITQENILKNGFFTVYIDRIIFKEVLSQEEEDRFFFDIKKIGGIPTSPYNEAFSNFIIDTLLYIILIVLVLFCALSIIIQLFKNIIECRIYEFYIYKIFGIDFKMICKLFYIPLFIVNLFSDIIAVCVYFITEPLQEMIGFGHQLNFKIIIYIFFLIAILLGCTTIKVFRWLVLISPVEIKGENYV